MGRYRLRERNPGALSDPIALFDLLKALSSQTGDRRVVELSSLEGEVYMGGRSPIHLIEKLRGGARLQKAHRGEIRLVDDLSERMQGVFARRMDRLMKDLSEGFKGDSDV